MFYRWNRFDLVAKLVSINDSMKVTESRVIRLSNTYSCFGEMRVFFIGLTNNTAENVQVIWAIAFHFLSSSDSRIMSQNFIEKVQF